MQVNEYPKFNSADNLIPLHIQTVKQSWPNYQINYLPKFEHNLHQPPCYANLAYAPKIGSDNLMWTM